MWRKVLKRQRLTKVVPMRQKLLFTNGGQVVYHNLRKLSNIPPAWTADLRRSLFLSTELPAKGLFRRSGGEVLFCR